MEHKLIWNTNLEDLEGCEHLRIITTCSSIVPDFASRPWKCRESPYVCNANDANRDHPIGHFDDEYVV